MRADKFVAFNQEISGEDIDSQKIAFVCLRGSAKSLIAADQLTDADLMCLSHAMPADGSRPPSPEERWDVSRGQQRFRYIVWTFITGRVENLIARLVAQ